jgi:hypothetical protein
MKLRPAKGKSASNKAPNRKAARGVAKSARRARLGQIRDTLSMTMKADSKFLPIVLGGGLGTFAVFIVLGVLASHPILFGIVGFMLALVVAMSLAGRRAGATAYKRLEGQPGAAFAVLSGMRGDWRVTQAVEYNRNFDLVHRVIGKPGVVLVAEGSGARPRELIGVHAKKVRRVVGDRPIYDVVVGDDEGQVPLRKLQQHLTKLPHNLKPREVNELESRLRAVGGPNVPIPKGPMPKGGKIPRGKIR